MGEEERPALEYLSRICTAPKCKPHLAPRASDKTRWTAPHSARPLRLGKHWELNRGTRRGVSLLKSIWRHHTSQVPSHVTRALFWRKHVFSRRGKMTKHVTPCGISPFYAVEIQPRGGGPGFTTDPPSPTRGFGTIVLHNTAALEPEIRPALNGCPETNPVNQPNVTTGTR